MWVLTDDPEIASPFVAEQPSWRRADLAELPVRERSLWRELGGDRPAWRSEAPSAPPFWSGLVIIDHAPASQFDRLRELARTGRRLPGPVACLALTGEGFHGHRQRPWQAERGNLHLSVGFEPRLPVARLPGLTMLPAVATVAAVRAATADAVCPGIKWVNDVLWQGRKLAGVLSATQSRQLTVESAVLGVGLNVACSPAVAPTPFVPAVGSLADCGLATVPALPALLWALLDELARGCAELASAGLDGVLARYRQASLVVGEQVRIYDETFGELDRTDPWPEPLARGTVVAIEQDLGLRLADRSEPVTRGRLAFEAACVELLG